MLTSFDVASLNIGIRCIRGIDVKKPPLVSDRGQTRGGFLLNGQIPKMIIKKSAKNMIFELFRTFKSPNKGGFLIKGGFLTSIPLIRQRGSKIMFFNI